MQKIIDYIRDNVTSNIYHNSNYYSNCFQYNVDQYSGRWPYYDQEPPVLTKMSIYLQAWQDLFHPGLHYFQLHGDLSGSLVLGANTPLRSERRIKLRGSIVDMISELSTSSEVSKYNDHNNKVDNLILLLPKVNISHLAKRIDDNLDEYENIEILSFTSPQHFIEQTDNFFKEFGFEIKMID